MPKTYTTWYKKTLYVLQKYIDDAMRRESASCMVSDMLKEELPVNRVLTDSATIRMTHQVTGMRYVFLTPMRVQEYIADWDEGRPIVPFEFKLGNPIQITQSKPTIVREIKPLDVSKASSREIKDAIKKGSNITGKTVINHSPKNKDRAPIVVGGNAPPLRTIFGPMRRYGFRGLARRYGDMEAKAREEGRLEGMAQALAAAKSKSKSKR